MIDLSTKAGVLAFCESRRDEMVRSFERVGRFEVNGFSFVGFVFATHDITVPTRECRLPAEFRERIPREQHTQAFAHVMRLYARITRSIGSVFMAETWHAEHAGPRDELPPDLEDAPGRREALFMNLEHTATGRRTWKAEIRRNPDRVEPWREPFGEADMRGRLVDLAEWRS